MKNIIITSCAFVMAFGLQAQFNLPAASPKQKVVQDFGAGSVELTYCRPSMKGRKIFGALEKYGEVWRTGANDATKIRFTEPVMIANQKLDSGTYALFTIPNEKEWIIIFNKGYNDWGAYDYKKEEDVLRVAIKPMAQKPAMELFTIEFQNIKKDAIDMRIVWENTQVIVPITMDIKTILKMQLDKAMMAEKKPYGKAAQYYNEIANDPKTALEYCDKGIEANGKAGYKSMYYKVKVLDQMGNKSEAKALAEKAMTLANEANDKDYADAFQEQITEFTKVAVPVKAVKK
jgi:tetratricopeptide (TPR) repeat protein